MNRAWQVPQELDHEAMHRAAQALVGKHDFTTFRSVHCQAKDPVKSLDRLDVERNDAEIRIYVGMGRWREERVAEVLEARDRQELGLNAPPHGLYFVEAIYPEEA